MLNRVFFIFYIMIVIFSSQKMHLRFLQDRLSFLKPGSAPVPQGVSGGKRIQAATAATDTEEISKCPQD